MKELTGATVSPSLWPPSAAREARSKLLGRQKPEGPSTPSFPMPAVTMPGGCRRPWPPAKGSGAAAGAVGSSTAGPAGMPWKDLPSAAISCCGGEKRTSTPQSALRHTPALPEALPHETSSARRAHPGRAGPAAAAAAAARVFPGLSPRSDKDPRALWEL